MDKSRNEVCMPTSTKISLAECLYACQKSRITFTGERVSKESAMVEEEEVERAWVFPAFPRIAFVAALFSTVLCCVSFAFAL